MAVQRKGLPSRLLKNGSGEEIWNRQGAKSAKICGKTRRFALASLAPWRFDSFFSSLLGHRTG